jgi:hypothetical protein
MRTSWRAFAYDQPGALTVLHATQQTAGVWLPADRFYKQQRK